MDRLEQLTEYSILESVPSVALTGSELVYTQPEGSRWPEVHQGRVAHWRKMLERIGAEDILLLEFGVAWGESIRDFVGLNRSPRSLFFGFDSFQGLPEQWRSTHKGAMSADGRVPDIDDERLTFVAGWFKDTLPEQKARILAAAQGRTVIIHFDADLYSSTLYLLFALYDMFDQYYFIFDEFGGHEVRALYNFQQATGATCEFYFHNTGGGLPTVVSGLLQNR